MKPSEALWKYFDLNLVWFENEWVLFIMAFMLVYILVCIVFKLIKVR